MDEVAEFWRVARRLHAVYVELDRMFELSVSPCAQLEAPSDSSDPAAMEQVREWFEQMDVHVQVWQLRQLLQSTNLQNEENLRYLIARHLEKKEKTEADKDKVDFLLVQYFAHCAPHGLTDTGLDEVARVLEPALGKAVESFPEWAPSLDDRLHKLNHSNSLEDLQNSGALQEVRELKLAVGDEYFDPGHLVAFTRFNFLARRAFFQAMHFDLHAIRSAVNELERMGHSTVDCRDAGLTECESLDQVRHVVHQWKTPFRAPYSGGASFLQLILLRHALQRTLEEAGVTTFTQMPTASGMEAKPKPVAIAPEPKFEIAPDIEESSATASPIEIEENETPAPAKKAFSSERTELDPSDVISRPAQSFSSVNDDEENGEESYLGRCVADIAEQLSDVPPKNSPAVSAIVLGGCKLLIATWEAHAFAEDDETAKALQRTVAARTILHVCMERYKKNEPTDLAAALEIARGRVEEMKTHVEAAKEAKNIDAAVNLAATSKRLVSLIAESEKLPGSGSV
jgi:hypothetical protein